MSISISDQIMDAVRRKIPEAVHNKLRSICAQLQDRIQYELRADISQSKDRWVLGELGDDFVDVNYEYDEGSSGKIILKIKDGLSEAAKQIAEFCIGNARSYVFG